MPDDYFGRLLARYAPAPGGASPGSGRTDRAGRTLVQPRLPGPFERIEALSGPSAEPDGPAPRALQAPRSARAEEGQIRYEREIRTTERQTVLRTEVPRQDEAPDPAERQLRLADGLLRPTTDPGPGPRPGPTGAVRPRRTAGTRTGDDRAAHPTASTLVLPGLDTAPVAPVTPLRPRTDEPPTARPAARTTATGRRGQRAAERVVHVQIGRLEVSAAGPERPAADRPARTERHEPTLSLADYLARGERTH
ncbi:hypothetical protein AB0F24_01245 [Streptomyces platensis]|uniref:hypothetical protein n=1 Tax=Streptomyces platensis TaxID=58346 RepID=UPI0033CCEF91